MYNVSDQINNKCKMYDVTNDYDPLFWLNSVDNYIVCQIFQWSLLQSEKISAGKGVVF